MAFHRSGAVARFLLVAIALTLSSSPAWAQPEVKVQTGTLRGLDENGVEAFLGVPYAQPPVGPLRWHAPAAPKPWQNVRDATRLAPACLQPFTAPTGPYGPEFLVRGEKSEDCLYLNIWRPAASGEKRPVYVFIHGGSFRGGAGSVPVYNGSGLARQGAVVVNLNYRLGIFGFFAHPDLTRTSPIGQSGNYGLLDQIAALRWIKANIAAFGGDPGNVTVAGESAGATSVNLLMMSPLAKILFQRIVSISGPIVAPPPPLADLEAKGIALTKRVAGGSLEAFQAMPADMILQAAVSAGEAGGDGAPPIRFGPNLDGLVVAADLQSPVPLLGGYNENERWRDIFTDADGFRTAVTQRYGALAPRLLALYPHATEEEAHASHALLKRDHNMTRFILWARERVMAHEQPVYGYVYDQPYPPTARGQNFGAHHTAAVPYIMGSLDRGQRNFSATDQEVSRQLQSHWLAFMRTGNPSLPGVAWSPITPQTNELMGLGAHHGVRQAVSSAERFDLLKQFLEQSGGEEN